MIFEQISLDIYDANLAIIEFINPPFNLFSSTMLEEINRGIDYIINDFQINSLVFYGGDKMFSAGLELEKNELEDSVYVLKMGKIIEDLYAKFDKNNLTITTAVCGFANGLGFDLFDKSSIKIISDSAKFSAMELDTEINFLSCYKKEKISTRLSKTSTKLLMEQSPAVSKIIDSCRTYTAAEISQLIPVDKTVPMEEVLLTAIKYNSMGND